MAFENDAPLEGSEQTPAPVTPAPAEEAPHETARQTVRRAFEEVQAKAAEREEPRARAIVNDDGEDAGKPAIDRTRDPQGRFLKGESQEPSGEKEAQQAPKATENQEPLPGEKTLRPPPGWNAAARVAFDHLPQEVKEAVAKRENDFSAGIQAKDQALQPYKGLEAYTPVIQASGLTHAELTKRAVEWEQSLNTNPLHTALHLTGLAAQKATGIQRQILEAHYSALAQAIQQHGGQAPPQLAPQQQVPQQQTFQSQATSEDIEARIRQVLAEREAHSSVDEFLSNPKNIHAEAVADLMALFIREKSADDLEQAYDMACNAVPEIRALLTRQASANPASVSETERARRRASEAKAAAKATIGAPSGPRPEQKEALPKTTHDAVHRAYREVRERSGI